MKGEKMSQEHPPHGYGKRKKAFHAKRRALKGEKTYLDDDLAPTKVAHRKENMPQLLK